MLRLLESRPPRDPDHLRVGYDVRLFEARWKLAEYSIRFWGIESHDHSLRMRHFLRIGLDRHTGQVLDLDPIVISGARITYDAPSISMPTELALPCFDVRALSFEGSWVDTDRELTAFEVLLSDRFCTIAWGEPMRALCSGRVAFGVNEAGYLVSVGVRWLGAKERERVSGMIRSGKFP